MNQLACKCVDYLIVNEIIPSDMREVYVYAFEVLFGKILNYGTLLILAYINHNIIPTLLFMMIFLSLRGRTGGYHASHPISCYLGTFIIYYSVSWVIAPFLHENIHILLWVFGISIIVIFLYAPINHPNLGLNKKEIQVCKSSSRWLSVLILVCVIISVWLEINSIYISYAAAGIGMDAGLLILAKILKQEVQKDEECERNNFKRYG